MLSRLLGKVIQTDGCWEWIGCRDRRGYGRIGVGSRTEFTHRVMWRSVVSEIPTGVNVLHHCDNPSCVRPDHLFLGTQDDNMKDARNKGRVRKGEDHGMRKLSEEDVLRIRSMGGTLRYVASLFGISNSMVCMIRNRKYWAHVC